jgi:Ca-activated chloride channel homolog
VCGLVADLVPEALGEAAGAGAVGGGARGDRAAIARRSLDTSNAARIIRRDPRATHLPTTPPEHPLVRLLIPSSTPAVRLAFVLVIIVGATIAVVAGHGQATFRGGVQTVALYATVRDASGRLVPDLDRAAFQVLDDGRPAGITVFSNEVQPFTAAIMLDMSGSMLGRVLTVRDSARRFIDALSARDRARIGTFGVEVAISPLLTGDKAVLTRVLAEELWPGGFTPLWRATMAAMSSLGSEPGRRVILVLSDGQDSDRSDHRPGPGDVKRLAVQDAFMVYAIGFEGPGFSSELADVAEETGGGHFELKSDADIANTFARVAEELRHQYLLGFSPTVLDGKTHKVEVRIAGSGFKVRAAKSYVAKEPR